MKRNNSRLKAIILNVLFILLVVISVTATAIFSYLLMDKYLPFDSIIATAIKAFISYSIGSMITFFIVFGKEMF